MTTDTIMPESEMEDLSRRAHALYRERFQSLLEATHNGEFVAIHPDAADYAVGATSSAARFALRRRYPQGMIVTTRIGPDGSDSLAYRILASQFASDTNK